MLGPEHLRALSASGWPLSRALAPLVADGSKSLHSDHEAWGQVLIPPLSSCETDPGILVHRKKFSSSSTCLVDGLQKLKANYERAFSSPKGHRDFDCYHYFLDMRQFIL